MLPFETLLIWLNFKFCCVHSITNNSKNKTHEYKLIFSCNFHLLAQFFLIIENNNKKTISIHTGKSMILFFTHHQLVCLSRCLWVYAHEGVSIYRYDEAYFNNGTCVRSFCPQGSVKKMCLNPYPCFCIKGQGHSATCFLCVWFLI